MARGKSSPLTGEVMTPEEERAFQQQAGAVMATMPDYEPPDPEADPDDVALDGILAELGGDSTNATVNVYRIGAKGEREFVGQFAPSEYSLPMIQAQFGGGEYRVEVRQNNRWLTKKTVKIAAPRTPALSHLGMASAPSPAAPDTGKMIEAMQAGFTQIGTMIAQAFGQIAQAQPKPKTAMETLQELAMMKEIMGVGAAPASQSPLEVLTLAKDLAGMIQPREGDPGAGEIMIQALDKLGPLFATMGQQRPPAAAPMMPPPAIPAPAMPAPGEMPAPQPQPQPQPVEGDEMNMIQRMYLNLLVANAKAESDPYTYAAMALDMQGDEAALAYANNPAWFEELCKVAPEAANYRPWFEEMRTAIFELTKPETPDTTGGTPAP